MKQRKIKFRLTYDDKGPDKEGKRSFTLEWEDPDGVFRPEPSKKDGKPVGYRRGQCFRTVPEEFIARTIADGHEVEVVE